MTAWIGGPFASMLPFWEAAAWGWGMDYDTQHHIAAGTRKRREAYLRSVSAGIRGVGNFIGIAIVNPIVVIIPLHLLVFTSYPSKLLEI